MGGFGLSGFRRADLVKADSRFRGDGVDFRVSQQPIGCQTSHHRYRNFSSSAQTRDPPASYTVNVTGHLTI